MKTLYDLMLDVARHLTGRDIELNFTNRKSLGALGCARTDFSGKSVIDLATDAFPTCSGEDCYLFLHELAHISLHKFKHTDTTRPPEPNPKINKPLETQADKLARTWERWAIQHAESSIKNGRSVLENRLTALLQYPN